LTSAEGGFESSSSGGSTVSMLWLVDGGGDEDPAVVTGTSAGCDAGIRTGRVGAGIGTEAARRSADTATYFKVRGLGQLQNCALPRCAFGEEVYSHAGSCEQGYHFCLL